jgi:hypothetical protein
MMGLSEQREQAILDRMTELVCEADGDAEAAHAEADGLLVEIVRAYGHDGIADQFEKMLKWYA